MEAVRWVRQTKYNGKTVWRLNHPKLERKDCYELNLHSQSSIHRLD